MPANSVIQLRRGTAAQWTSANPVLANGEPGYETDTGKEKRGDGTTAWTSLAYFAPGNGAFAPLSGPAYLLPAPSGGDDAAALAAAAAAAPAGSTLTPRAGLTYLLNSTFTVPQNMSLDLNGATFKANATIAGPVVDTSVGTATRWVSYRNGTIDANNKAQNCFYPRYVWKSGITGLMLLNSTQHGLILGDPAATSASYGLVVDDVVFDRGYNSTVASGAYGVWVRNATDNRLSHVFSIGQETGFRCDGSDNQFSACHAWGTGMVTCFDDNGTANEYAACIADTPTTYGFRLRTAANQRIIGGQTYVNALYGVDNTVIGIHTDTNPAFLTVIGHFFHGNDASHRLAKDIETSDATDPMLLGCQYSNVVAFLSPTNRITNGLQVNGSTTFLNQMNQFGSNQKYAAAGTVRYSQYSTGSSVAGASLRWQVGANATAEGGSNAGSDYDIVSRTDAGSFLATVLRVFRANGIVQSFAGVATKVKGGTPADADYAVAPPDGTIVGDSTGSKIWIRLGGAWKSVAVA